MLERLHALAAQRADFAFETTLAGRTLAGWLKSFRETGYAVHLVYFWLQSPDVAVLRVAERVKAGGHSVPAATIRQRYRRSLRNLFRLYQPVVTTWRVYDNTHMGTSQPVAEGDSTGSVTVLAPAVWEQMRKESEL